MNIAKILSGFGLILALPLWFGGDAIGQPTLPIEGNWFLENIQAPQNIPPSPTLEKIVIAIVDDGVRISHQDLKQFIWKNPNEIPDNGIDDDGNSYIDDVHGWDVSDNNNTVTPPLSRLKDYHHGTNVAGIVAQIARRAYGDAAFNRIQIMPIKSLSDRANSLYLKDGYKGIEYALNAGADIVICSWGVGHISSEESDILDRARKQGILVIASAGNIPEEREQFPAAHDSTLAVAALDQNDLKIEMSSYGQFIDLSAPGINIQSAGVLSDTDYKIVEGTSFAVPMVATGAALIKLQNPTFSSEQVEACLKSSAHIIDAPDSEFSAKIGAGKLNIKGAMKCSLLNKEIAEKNQIHNPRGFLYFKKSQKNIISWTIKPQGQIKGMSFKPRAMGGTPGKGVLSFFSDATPDAKLIASYLLSDLPKKIYVPGTTAHVTFEADQVGTSFNGLMEFRADTIDFRTLYCQDTKYLDNEGTFEDGSLRNDYSNNSDCKWLITAPEGNVINFKFSQFDTQPKEDLVYFFNGAGTHEKIMAIFSGPNIPPEFTTWRNQVLVWFVTSRENPGRGWKAEYRFLDK
jgi:serine protease